MRLFGRLKKASDEWAAIHYQDKREAASLVCRILVEMLDVPIKSLKPNMRLVEDLRMDELEPVEVVMALEEELNREVSEDEAKQWNTVHDMVLFIDSLK